MQAYDYLILVLLLACAAWGARRGFAKQLASLLSITLGYLAAVNFREQVAASIDVPHPWNRFAAMAGLFVATSLAVWIAFRFVREGLEKAGLTSFDTQLGGLFGIAKGVLLSIALTMFGIVLLGDDQRAAMLGSFSGKQICHIVRQAKPVVPSEWQEVLTDCLAKADVGSQDEQMRADTDAYLVEDPFASDSPSDLPAFSDALESVPPKDSTHSPFPQARLRTPVFDR